MTDLEIINAAYANEYSSIFPENVVVLTGEKSPEMVSINCDEFNWILSDDDITLTYKRVTFGDIATKNDEEYAEKLNASVICLSPEDSKIIKNYIEEDSTKPGFDIFGNPTGEVMLDIWIDNNDIRFLRDVDWD